MSDYNQAESGSGLKTAIFFGAIIALLAANVYLFLQMQQIRTDMVTLRESIATEVATLRDAAKVSTATSVRNVESVKGEMERMRTAAAIAASAAKAEAQNYTKQVAEKLTEEQKRAQQTLGSQISEVKEVAATATTKIADVSTEVGQVKTEVQATKSELEKTIDTLKSTRGDLGVQSGLIATNAKELDALKRLGERNYFEFNLRKTKQPQKVGDIAVKLNKTDTKRNKFTIEVYADDKRTEKKDRTLNEPVQFYTLRARQPYEIVVNQVNKDQIVGYLATPKVQSSRN